ncbi:MAG: DUF1428 domain-containing protein [Defluviimonas sp.]|uniref:DUF1428 domain-containing protein n=1 Tax=Albidovulum sp. TaxID=1872424 RepID=UPI001DB21333|nr:DUF1428 domain-containing protein [Paracoccaceae bacterium]MCC0063790.1 DUF1428 domain-containing protein [Defluviimonas sp.]
MSYVDGFVIPVPTANREAYRAHEAKWWPFFRDHGAKGLVICWGDDVPDGKVTDFKRAVAATSDETVAFCWMTWPDKATRNAAFAKMMADNMAMPEMPFDGKRLIHGGFEPILIEGDPA